MPSAIAVKRLKVNETNMKVMVSNGKKLRKVNKSLVGLEPAFIFY